MPASSNFAASYYESYITCAPQPLTSSPWKPVGPRFDAAVLSRFSSACFRFKFTSATGQMNFKALFTTVSETDKDGKIK